MNTATGADNSVKGITGQNIDGGVEFPHDRNGRRCRKMNEVGNG